MEDRPMSSRPDTEVRNNTAESRYEIFAGGKLAGFSKYLLEDDRVVLFDTQVDPARRGAGLGQQLAQTALEDVRKQRKVVEPRCEFIAKYIREHPEHHDLVATEDRSPLRAAS